MGGKGDLWQERTSCFEDEVSGIEILRLTDYKGHSSVLYFTDQYWLDAQHFFFVADRENRSNLFLYDLKNYESLQLTDFNGEDLPNGLYSAPAGGFIFFYGNSLYKLTDDNWELVKLAELPPTWETTGMHAVSSTGDYAYTAVRERVHSTDRRLVYNKSPHYLEKFQDHPRSDIIRIDLANGSTEVVYSEDHFIEHVNINPTDPGILSFCHEGPWAKTEQRIWVLDLRKGGTWKIRPQQGGSAIGHEFFINSDWIGYHGRRLPDEKMHFFGATKIDNSEYFEYDFPYHCTHFVSCGFDWFLGDGTPVNVQPWFPSQQRPFLMLFRRNGNGFEGPRVLANHRSTFAEQVQHPHARFSPDGSGVLYASDIGGYTNIYYIQLPEFESLPLVEDVKLGW